MDKSCQLLTIDVIELSLILCEPVSNVKEVNLRSTHNLSCRPELRLGGEKSARTPRAPAGDFAPCTPISEWISDSLSLQE